MSETHLSSSSAHNPDNWNKPALIPNNPFGTIIGDAPGFRDVRVIDHPTSTLVIPNVPTRSAYAGYHPVTGVYDGEQSRYYLPGSLAKVFVRNEVAWGLEAVHEAARKYIPQCDGICVMDGFRTHHLQCAAILQLVSKHLAEAKITNLQQPIDQRILFDCAHRAGQIWSLLGLEADSSLTAIQSSVQGDEKLMRELKDIAAMRMNIKLTQLTDDHIDDIVEEYIRIVYSTGLNNDRHPEIAQLHPLINNGSHMSGAATDAKLIGKNGRLLPSHVPFDYPFPSLSSELALETEAGIQAYTKQAGADPWLQEHLREQGMDPLHLTDADIDMMRRNQRYQTNIMLLAGVAPYVSGESWHGDWPENPMDPLSGKFVRTPSAFLREKGWASGNSPYVAERYGPGADMGNGGVPSVFGGKQAYKEARRLGLME